MVKTEVHNIAYDAHLARRIIGTNGSRGPIDGAVIESEIFWKLVARSLEYYQDIMSKRAGSESWADWAIGSQEIEMPARMWSDMAKVRRYVASFIGREGVGNSAIVVITQAEAAKYMNLLGAKYDVNKFCALLDCLTKCPPTDVGAAGRKLVEFDRKWTK